MIELSGVQITPFARFTLLHDSALVSTYTAAYSTDIQQMLGRFVTVCFSAHSDNAQFSLPLRSRIIKLLKSVVVLSQSLAAKSSDSLTLARVSEALRSLVMSQIKATAAAQLFLDAIELNGRFAADVLDTDQRLVLNALRVASGF
jgi:shikimate kinase